MSQDQEIVGAEPDSSGEAEGSVEEPINALPEIETEMIMEAEKQISETSSEETENEKRASSSEEAPTEISPALNGDDVSHPMDALLEEDSYELEMPRRGEIRVGTVARVTETDVLVDVGAKSEGVIPARELERIPEEQRADLIVGKDVEVYVLRSGARDGNLILSVTRAQEEQDWRQAEKLLESRELFEGIVAGFNKGGLIIKMGRLRGFVPASQVSLSRRRRAHGSTPDQRWGKMVDEPMIAKVIEVDRRRNRLILSERAATREARDALKERLITELEPGEIRTGHVISLADFGAFVDIGGADGLVHMSEISWKRISHPREVLKVGQAVEVKVLGVDPDRKRISLSMRELESDPWDKIVDQYQEGQLVEGTITKLTKFGAFASLVGTEDFDIEGLIHISELADRRVEHPREVVQEGQTIALRVIKLDRERKRIGLSLKRVSSAEYAEQDWQAAMQDIDEMDEEGIGVALPEEVEDFDAALEAEVGEVPEAIEEGDEDIPSEVSDAQVDADVEDAVEEVSRVDEPVSALEDETGKVESLSIAPSEEEQEELPPIAEDTEADVEPTLDDSDGGAEAVTPSEDSDAQVGADEEDPVEEVSTVDEPVSTLEDETGEVESLSEASSEEVLEELPPIVEDAEADVESTADDSSGGKEAATPSEDSDAQVGADAEDPVEEVSTVDEPVSTLEDETGEVESLSEASSEEVLEELPHIVEDAEADVEPTADDSSGGKEAATPSEDSDAQVGADEEDQVEEVSKVDESVSTLENETGEVESLSEASSEEEREELPPIAEDTDADVEPTPDDSGGGTDAAM